MKLNTLKYLFVYITPAVILFSLSSTNYWSYFALIFIFVIIPSVELFTKGSTANFSQMEEEVAKNDRFYDFLLYALVPVQYFTLFYFLNHVSVESLPLSVKIGLTTAYGMSCGVLGINAAHELGHRNTWHEQLMSKMLLLSTLYTHFFIEHNRGHHRNVSTDNDPASSRYGELVYTFYFRSIFGGWISAWKLEAERLKKKDVSVFSLQNEMLRFQLIEITLIAFIGYMFGLETLLFFIIGSIIGAILLETVNYIEHYGLRRKIKGNKYERTLPIHSWNSNHPFGRLLLLELSRHSDHHFMANRKYQILRHFDDSPQMPTGYPGMMLLALFPPLWFMVMHKQIKYYEEKRVEEAAV